MTRIPISLDCDGVLADGGYTPPEARTNEAYNRKGLVHPALPIFLHQLSMMYDLFVISMRYHESANLGLRAWLYYACGCGPDVFAGVITNHEGRDDPAAWKAGIVNAIGIPIHVDDDPAIIANLPGRGIWMPSDLPGPEDGMLPMCRTWEDLATFLGSPGAELHGASGTVVRSPAAIELYAPPPEQTAVAATVQ